jgi:hypothetical protein
MAKISARGATEVARVRGQREGADFQMIYVMCSDGRVLRRSTGEFGSGYSVRGKVSRPENRTAEYLRAIVKRDGLKVVE